eukprot:CAMPEP_0202894790 /NCGR_PEP_ID=MMETSP1392-20130828/4111_1 /ASSEMBLY_ACC=CAM_ASM_000868 /TAXON_ID=225041 /ORGANISM="Chlamydomonas chlamydogama, Strain SAG 11-48b" /LENGTH=304 /DNA_ID=CAMNT_0049579581 /DNA_START=42 /DNA_END=956 /DNA_ORIENTATION=-
MASNEELEEVEAELRNWKSGVPPADKLSKYLRLIRELKIRESDATTRYGSLLLRYHKGALNEEELWLVHEQVAVAALDAGAYPFAASLIRAVARRFPDSSRTRRLQGMYWEASGSLDRAAELYGDALSENPTNETIAKRLVALEKSRGNMQGAVEALKKYLDIYSGDREAWEELADLYLELLMYRQALFCYEELLMFLPTHPHYLIRYADVLYTMGGSSNYRMARAYYAKAVESSGGRSVRALWGILACCANITEKVALQDSRTRAQIDLPNLTTQALINIYREYAPDKLPVLQSILEKQGLLD